MKSKILTTLFSFIFLIGYAQDSLALFKRKQTGLVEISPVLGYIFTPDERFAISGGVSLRGGYFFRPKTAVIVDFLTVASKSNFISVVESYNSFGVSLRQYLGKTQRNGFYAQLGYTIADARISKTTARAEKNFPSQLINGALGMSLRLKPNWYLNYTAAYNYSIDGLSFRSRNIGLTYLFNSKYKDYPKIQRDLALLKRQKDSASYKGQFQIANDFFIFPFPESDFGEKYTAYQWSNRIGYFVTPSISVGLSSGLEFGQPRISENRLFYWTGPYANLRVLKRTKTPVYFELGYAYSNMSIREVGLPQNSITHYLNTGAGMNVRLRENTYLDLGIVLMNYMGGEVKCKDCGGSSIFRIGIENFIR